MNSRTIKDIPLRVELVCDTTDTWRLRLVDDRAAVVIVDTHLSPLQFTKLMRGGSQQTLGTLWVSDCLGRQLKVEHILVPCPTPADFPHAYEEAQRTAEMHGWRLDLESGFNRHKMEQGQYRFTARWWRDVDGIVRGEWEDG